MIWLLPLVILLVPVALLAGTVAGSALPGPWPLVALAALAGLACWLLRAARRT